MPFWKRKPPIPVLHEISPPAPQMADTCGLGLPKPPREVIEQITQRVLAMVHAGYVVKELYQLKNNDGPGLVCLPSTTQQGTALLLFTTPVYAKEYARVSKLNASVVSIGAEKISSMAETYARAGVVGFVLNRCPRCAVFFVAALDTLNRPGQLDGLCALDLVIKKWKMDQVAATAFASLRGHGFMQAIPLFESLRDHLNPGEPLIPYLLALMGKSDPRPEIAPLPEISRWHLIELGRRDLSDRVPEDPMQAMAEAALLLHQAARGVWKTEFSPPAT